MPDIKGKKIIYFAHHMNDYGSEKEAEALEFLRAAYPRYEVVCPNNDLVLGINIESYIQYVEEEATKGVVIMEHRGHIGKGVWREASAAIEKGRPVHVIRKGNPYHREITDISIMSPPQFEEGYKLYRVKGFVFVDKTDWGMFFAKLIV